MIHIHKHIIHSKKKKKNKTKHTPSMWTAYSLPGMADVVHGQNVTTIVQQVADNALYFSQMAHQGVKPGDTATFVSGHYVDAGHYIAWFDIVENGVHWVNNPGTQGWPFGAIRGTRTASSLSNEMLALSSST